MLKPDSAHMRYDFKRPEDKVFPPMVYAKITNVCNLACIHCPYTYISRQKSYVPRHMEWAIYKKIVDETALYPDVILRLVCDGEPLLHPEFMEMLAYAKRKSIPSVCFNTNGTLLDKKRAEAIIENSVSVVEISLDALNKTTYESIRRGSSFEKVMKNTLDFIALRDKRGARTKVMVSIIDQPEAENEREDFIRFWEPRVDKVIIRQYTTIGGLVEKGRASVTMDGCRWPCPLLWTRMFVNVDGEVEFCVEDWEGKTVVGDFRKETLSCIWQSATYAQLRQYHQSHNFKKISYCSRCKDWQARNWEYDYFYALEHMGGQ